MTNENNENEKERRDAQAEPAPFITGGDVLKGLSNLGLNEISGPKELVDNSIDAQSGEIDIWVEDLGKDDEGTHHRMLICKDDGRGFKDENVERDGRAFTLLTHAVTYGGRVELDGALQRIGKFGWGLPSTIVHLTKQAEVITKTESENRYRSCEVDLKRMGDDGDFRLTQNRKEWREIGPIPGPIDRPLKIERSGTIVWLKDILSEYSTKEMYVRELIKEFGMTYRKYLESGLKIRVNGNPVEFNDPLCEHPQSRERQAGIPEPTFTDEFSIIFDGVRSKDDSSEDGHIHWKHRKIDPETSNPAIVDVRLTRMNAVEVRRINKERREEEKRTPEEECGRRFNMENQGFYLVRNERQIRGGEDFGLYTTQDRLNYFRGEIKFPTCLDSYFGIEADKTRLTMNPTLRTRLKDKLAPVLTRMRAEHDNEVDGNRSEEAEEEPEIESIVSDAKALPRGGASQSLIDEATKARSQELESRKQEISDNSEIPDWLKAQKISRVARMQREERKLYMDYKPIPSPALHEIRVRSRGIDVVVNTMTKWYEHVYAPSLKKPDERKLLDMMLWGIGWAEYTMVEDVDDENAAFWSAARESMGASMGRLVDQFRKTYKPEVSEDSFRVCHSCQEEDGDGNYILKEEYDLNVCRVCKHTICGNCGSFDGVDWEDEGIDLRTMFVCHVCRNQKD